MFRTIPPHFQQHEDSWQRGRYILEFLPPRIRFMFIDQPDSQSANQSVGQLVSQAVSQPASPFFSCYVSQAASIVSLWVEWSTGGEVVKDGGEGGGAIGGEEGGGGRGWWRHLGDTPFTRAATSVLSEWLLQKMTNSRQFSIACTFVQCQNSAKNLKA